MQHTTACDDCLVSVVLQLSGASNAVAFDHVGPTEEPMEFDEAEASAIHALAEAGLVPRLRLVPREDGEGSARDSSAPLGVTNPTKPADGSDGHTGSVTSASA